MKLKNMLLVLVLFAPSSLFAQDENQINPNQMLLPSPFRIYVNGTVVINHPMPGFVLKNLPTNNDYNLVPGCYIACYTHDKKNAVYPVSKDIYVVGQIRLAGFYNDRICIPVGYQNKDISAAPEFKQLCGKTFTSCGTGCWAGGDTAGWFGIQAPINAPQTPKK